MSKLREVKPKKYYMPESAVGREWKWWVKMNAHVCAFCRDTLHEVGAENMDKSQLADMGLGKQTGMTMTQKGYWNKLYQVWVRHMKEYHLDIFNTGR